MLQIEPSRKLVRFADAVNCSTPVHNVAKEAKETANMLCNKRVFGFSFKIIVPLRLYLKLVFFIKN